MARSQKAGWGVGFIGANALVLKNQLALNPLSSGKTLLFGYAGYALSIRCDRRAAQDNKTAAQDNESAAQKKAYISSELASDSAAPRNLSQILVASALAATLGFTCSGATSSSAECLKARIRTASEMLS